MRGEEAPPRGRCHGNVFLADGELYTGTVGNFQGNDPAISRSQSRRPIKTEGSLNWLQGEALPPPPPRGQAQGSWEGHSPSPPPVSPPRAREQSLACLGRLFGIPGLTLCFLPAPTDPAFVASAYIPESLGSLQGDDDKIYFFFSETGQEFEFFENTIVSRIARICKVRGWGTQSPHRLPRSQGQETPGGPASVIFS